MIGMEILKPVIVLAGWTMVMWLWMYITRLPAMTAAKIDSKTLVGGTGQTLDAVLPAKTQWIAHNYNHLHEAPTVFYAVALVLAMIGQGDGFNVDIAWGLCRLADSSLAGAGAVQPRDRAVWYLCLVEHRIDDAGRARRDGPVPGLKPSGQTGWQARHGSTSGTGRPVEAPPACNPHRSRSWHRAPSLMGCS